MRAETTIVPGKRFERRKFVFTTKPSKALAGDASGRSKGSGMGLSATQTIGKRTDVHEDLLSAPIGRNEAEAFIVLPFADSALIAHSDSLEGLPFVRG